MIGKVGQKNKRFKRKMMSKYYDQKYEILGEKQGNYKESENEDNYSRNRN